ncbi:AGAP004982-PA-like protein [Anopheles sinensis]|uniref:AGAP004982-PA-like protein n=1 Tax=Anopheles sinensis TaxID=74873 RepID=A0A084WDY3_ANOSI|nr:AGAP004982-PA-like protein [Anopheles sinensis]
MKAKGPPLNGTYTQKSERKARSTSSGTRCQKEVMQCRASVSSRYSLLPHTAKRIVVGGGGGGPAGPAYQRCQQSVVPRLLGKAAGEGFNVDSGFETSDFDFTDFAEEMLPSRDIIQSLSLEQDGLVGADGRSIPFRTGAADRRFSGLSARRMSDCPRRMLNLLHGAKNRRKSRISFDFSSDLHHQAEKSVQTSPIKHPNKNWRFEDARKAILVEMEAIGQLRKPHVLLLRFPDPALSKEIVQGYSSSIENVIFHRPATPRYCVVHVKPEADVDTVMKHISRIPFGAGKIMVERKTRNTDQKPVLMEVGSPHHGSVGGVDIYDVFAMRYAITITQTEPTPVPRTREGSSHFGRYGV